MSNPVYKKLHKQLVYIKTFLETLLKFASYIEDIPWAIHLTKYKIL